MLFEEDDGVFERQEKQLRELVDVLKQADSVIAFTGAGISTESGIPDFRSPGGIWSKYDPMEVGTIDAFHRDPEKFWAMFQEMGKMMVGVEPNRAHIALGQLQELGKMDAVVTQNVDGLHQAGGSKKVLELHGQTGRLACLNCGQKRQMADADYESMPRCQHCDAVMKPDAVMFGEMLPPGVFEEAAEFAENCDVCIVIGTSALVYPAAAIPEIAFRHGATLIQFGHEATPLTHSGTVAHFIEGSAGDNLSWLMRLYNDA